MGPTVLANSHSLCFDSSPFNKYDEVVTHCGFSWNFIMIFYVPVD